MSPRCSICRHPQRDSINVSLSRDGTRSTARLFQVSRPSLDRHKHHLDGTDDAADQVPQVTKSTDASPSLLSRIETLMGQCENALNQAQASKNISAIMRASMTYFEAGLDHDSADEAVRGGITVLALSFAVAKDAGLPVADEQVTTPCNSLVDHYKDRPNKTVL